MGAPFEMTMGVANNLLKPMSQLMRENPAPPFEEYSPFYAAATEGMVAHYSDIEAAMHDESRKVAMFEFGLVPQLFYAFDCAPLCLEFYPGFFAGLVQQVVYDFIEAAEEAGVPSDTCSTDRFIIGAALCGELPTNSFFVTSSSPCDGTRIAYPILHKILDCPMLFLDAPFRHDIEAIRYYARQLRDQLIPFLEKATGKKFDIDKFRETVVESNKAYEAMLEIHDAFMLKPAPHPGMLRMVPYTKFIQEAGSPRMTKMIELLRDDVKKRVREGRTQGPFEEKHRVQWVHVPPTYDRELFGWIEEHFGAMVVSQSLSSSAVLEPIDTSTLDTMLEGVAGQGLDMTMSLMRFDSERFVGEMLRAYNLYDCDCMFVTQHVGCNSVCGARGLIKKMCRKHDIPVMFIEFDYNDDRVLSPELMRTQIEEFFETVMV